ncbi:hypothetical protein CCMSSC00406_0008436 [Pleurotus cornucopiae]|uniref:Uncharacterized protein n=1 Tax=Pleurotus cornucopiae TaxID=5321 RepID=A0ACB7J9I6_PLECO|nr:hypothetical protein CCMSSC00406_0008436 [Pleurotus cornucopiae]
MPLSPTSHGNTNSRALRNQPAQYTTARRPTSRHSSASAPKNILPSLHWLFRSNIPRHRNSYIPAGVDIHKRNFFGMGEILSVITNPAETVRSLTESKRLLEEARREIEENRERAQIRPKHTFSRLPGFFPRKAEMTAIERALAGEPSFTVIFGASSVGKTALLREVLSNPKYHVLHFDLRIAGFADLGSLYQSLSQQMEQYFEEIAKQMEGYEDFEKEAWSFKHDRLNVEKRTMDSQNGNGSNGKVKTSDIARLMELFQSSLLKYWEFKPETSQDDHSKSRHGANTRRKNSQETTSSHTRVGTPNDASGNNVGKKSKWNFFRSGRFKRWSSHKTKSAATEKTREVPEKEEERTTPDKKIPVIFFDEAHKLPALIQSSDTMKCLLDSMLVLTKQDRLCHVIHATSDPFYQTWLRQLNVMQHCKIVTIGDCSKSETRTYYRDHILPNVPGHLRQSLVFERLYEAFGGKLAHWHDYINDYVNSNGTLDIKQSSHFLQAHALLNLHIIHSSQSDNGSQDSKDKARQAAGSPTSRHTNAESLHPALGPAGFKIYSPLNRPPSSLAVLNDGFAGLGMFPTSAPSNSAEFTAMHLLKVMSRITQPGNTSLPYFLLCREIGVREVDGMVKGKVLDLRWTDCVSREDRDDRRSRAMGAASGIAALGTHAGAESSGTAVELLPPPPPIIMEDSDGLVDISEREMPEPRYTAEPYAEEAYGVDGEEEEDFVVGPRLVPITPIMRFAMREVVAEYEDTQSVSEYASLSDVDEY